MSWMTDNADTLRDLAQQRRNAGLSTGKAAAGWNWKRPDPECGSFERVRAGSKAWLRQHFQQVLADYQFAAHDQPEIPF